MFIPETTYKFNHRSKVNYTALNLKSVNPIELSETNSQKGKVHE